MESEVKYIVTVLTLIMSLNVNAFNTNREAPIVGALLTNPSEVKEVSSFSNTFAFLPPKNEDITKFLNANSNKMLPMIFINHLLYDSQQGTYNTDVEGIVQAIKRTWLQPPKEIIFTFDEPMFNIRTACLSGVKRACDDVNFYYQESLNDIKIIIEQLKAKLPEISVGIMHVEAFVEMIWQKEDWPHRNVIMLEESDYVAFDCYGPVDRCGVDSILGKKVGYKSLMEYGLWLYDSMVELEEVDNKGRKMMMIPQAFHGTKEFTHHDSIHQMLWYLTIMKQYSTLIGGYGVFAWNHSDINLKYAKHSTILTNIMKFANNILTGAL